MEEPVITCRSQNVELTASLTALIMDSANTLKGSAKRLFMAGTVQELGEGGPCLAQRVLAWKRATIRNGARTA